MSELLKISKFKNQYRRSQGLKFRISKLRKIDEHLYSFYIYHPDCKYLSEITPIGCYWKGKHQYDIQLLDTKGMEDYTAEDMDNGNVLGGDIRLKLSGEVEDVLFKWVPLKWETTVFLIVDLKGNSIWNKEDD